MKKSLYFILMAVEFLVGFILLVLAASLIGWPYLFIVAAVWAALMVWQFLKFKKAEDDKAKRKAKTLMALIMLLPAVAAFAAIFWIGYKYF